MHHLLSLGDKISGRYELVRLLRNGGMGTLWVARHLELDSLVAIKFMGPEIASSEAARIRFRREAQSAARIRSVHVVQVFDYGVNDDELYLVMELLEGEDLGERLKRCGRLTLETAASMIVQASKGLARAHDLGIVHRDLKPSNLFLVRDEGDGGQETVKLLDFGIAKLADEISNGDATAPGEILGSPEFMSPEQAAGRPVDHRTDLWALALVFFRMVTGQSAFEGEGLSALLSMVIAEPHLTASTLVPELPMRVDRFFERALAREPQHRFQSARELAAAAALIAGLPPESISTRTPTSSPPRSGTKELPSVRPPPPPRSTSSVPPRSGTVVVPKVERDRPGEVTGIVGPISNTPDGQTLVSGDPKR